MSVDLSLKLICTFVLLICALALLVHPLTQQFFQGILIPFESALFQVVCHSGHIQGGKNVWFL